MTQETQSGFFDPLAGMKRAYRLYGRVIGDVDRLMSGSPLTPTERRVILELASHPGARDAQIGIELGLDRSHCSRVMGKLIRQGLVGQRPCPRHRSQRMLTLTDRGAEIARQLDAELGEALSRQFATMEEADQAMLLHASSAASSTPFESGPVHLRRPKLADLSWLFARTAMLDVGKHRSGEGFAAHMMGEMQAFLNQPVGDERPGWIAYRALRPVGGCLMTINEGLLHAKIGLIYTEPNSARLGIGRALIEACLTDAKRMALPRVTAEVVDRHEALTRLFRATGFQRSRAARIDHRYGPADARRDYEFNLPLRLTTPQEDN